MNTTAHSLRIVSCNYLNIRNSDVTKKEIEINLNRNSEHIKIQPNHNSYTERSNRYVKRTFFVRKRVHEIDKKKNNIEEAAALNEDKLFMAYNKCIRKRLGLEECETLGVN
ncbi:hypothetical protein O3G_MSEX010760 [Manduca sexta]|uniref:Uncharacterized protein n=1 Tax=Manduca sexta TaxID=7130 RepID=A0A921ZIM2_MANSE|nr:hypothetical protein O3G_MSEX010760 [Manduca sexta]